MFAIRKKGSSKFVESGVDVIDCIDGLVEGWENPDMMLFSYSEDAEEFLSEQVYSPSFEIEEIEDPNAPDECQHCGKVIDKPGFCSRGCYRADQAGL